MIDFKNFISAISQIEEEKGISREKILETVEMALAAAYKKDYGKRGQIIRAKLDSETGSFDIWQEKIVVDDSMIKTEEEIEIEQEALSRGKEISENNEDEGEKKVRYNEEKHIMLDDALSQASKSGPGTASRNSKKIKPGDILRFDLEVRDDFGRIAAQTAKQVIIQRIREAEREAVYEEYENKVDTIVSGIVQRVDGSVVFFDLGKTTGIMIAKDRIPGEQYRVGQRMRLYLTSIETSPKGPQLYLSRSHPKMLSRLFELEVPEISAETVIINSIAREPGARSKIAVSSNEDGIDPIGSCVGQRGTRVSAVIQELGGEKIDIIEWKEDPAQFIAHSLSPAKVLNVEVEKGRARVIVADDQLSLAIGKDGQNVRLAAKLTGWKIDIVSREDDEAKKNSEKNKSTKEKTTDKDKKISKGTKKIKKTKKIKSLNKKGKVVKKINKATKS